MNTFQSLFVFTRSQRNGLLLLVFLMVSVQLSYYFIDFNAVETNPPERAQWLALERKIDSFQRAKPKFQRFPYNPNFISDAKGYKIGMSVAEIDRLHAFRAQGRFVNSAAEFQSVTKVSDSLLAVISADFKFPGWVRKSRKIQAPVFREGRMTQIDINAATKEELMAVYGIGDALSDRILKQKEILGGFVSMEQMQDVWGLHEQVVEKLKQQFVVKTVPAVKKIKVNDASVKELAQFPYFRYALAKEIVTYRSMNGAIRNADDLKNIKNFPLDKISIIALYLEF